MTGSDFYQPLRRKGGGPKRRLPLAVVAVCLGLGVAAFGVAALNHGDQQGEPFAVGTIERPKAPAPASVPSPPVLVPGDRPVVAFATPDTDRPAGGSGPVVDIENGVKVTRPAVGTGPLVLKVPDAAPARTVQALAKAPDPRLLDTNAAGPLPRIGRDGARPDHVYAHQAVPVDGKPAVAILVGGMGLDRAATSEADGLLPGAVTFGFAPYGDDLAEQIRKARQAGHEVVLQMPMEGIGPTEALSHMLTSEDGNAERQRWLMSRFTGYAGVGNYLGARLLADDAALRPVLQELADRGLFFIDDGTASRSLAAPLGAELHLPVVRADVVLDARGDMAGLQAAFARLEALARERGLAVGSATGRPETVAVLSQLLSEAGKRGLLLIPVSQAASRDAVSPVAAGASPAPH